MVTAGLENFAPRPRLPVVDGQCVACKKNPTLLDNVNAKEEKTMPQGMA